MQHTRLNLRRDFDPKSLCVRVVKIDNFSQEYDNCGTPKHLISRFNRYKSVFMKLVVLTNQKSIDACQYLRFL